LINKIIALDDVNKGEVKILDTVETLSEKIDRLSEIVIGHVTDKDAHNRNGSNADGANE
jgi:hypothetical protein